MSERPAVRVRQYTPEEDAAFRAWYRNEKRGKYVPGNTIPQWAWGPSWPDAMEKRAAQMERLAPLYRIAAEAMRREQAIDIEEDTRA